MWPYQSGHMQQAKVDWCEGLVAQAAEYGLISGCVQQAKVCCCGQQDACMTCFVTEAELWGDGITCISLPLPSYYHPN